MANIQRNGFYHDPGLAQAASNLAGLFAPPSGSDAAGWAAANAKNAEAQRLAALYAYARDPNFSQQQFDRLGVGAGAYAPTQSYYAVDTGAATTRRGQDVDAATSRANNANTVRGGVIGQMYQPLNPGQVRPEVPVDIAGVVGLPAMAGTAGAPKPLSETEARGEDYRALRGDGSLTNQMIVDSIVGKEAPVQALGPGGTPQYMSPGAAVRQGAQPFVERKSGASAMAVLADGKTQVPAVQDTRTGQWRAAQTGEVLPPDVKIFDLPKATGSAAQIGLPTANAVTPQREVTGDDIDRVITAVEQNPQLTTGIIGQLTSGIGGTPAGDVSALLDSIKANVSFDQLQAMRSASPTGGALGAISDQEGKLLQSTLGSLQQSQSPSQFLYNLKRLKNVQLDIIHGAGKGPARHELGAASAPAGTAPTAALAPAAPTAGGLDPRAVEMLRANPALAPQFDEVFGQGAAQRALGGQ